MSSADQVLAPPASTAPWPTKVGHYRVTAPIGGGSAGTLFRCVDERTGDVHALKLAHGADGGQSAALRREFALLFQLSKSGEPGVVRALQSGHLEGRAWYAMEFVEGIDLGSLLRRLWVSVQPEGDFPTREVHDAPRPPCAPPSSGMSSRLPLPFVGDARENGTGSGHLRGLLELGRQLAAILVRLHAAGVVHADLSPRNVIVELNGSPKLIDFGSAFHAAAGRTREVAQSDLGVRGTPGFMSPEQIRGLPVDGRADLYAFGCILYEFVTGRPPFVADDAAALCTQHLRVTPIPPSVRIPGVPAELDRLVLGLLQKEPHRRLPYASDVVSALDALLEPIGAPRTDRISPPAPLYRARVVGRKPTVEALEARLTAARQGSSGAIFLLGEAGAGKTRLLNELATRAQHSGMEVIAGRCAQTRGTSGARLARAPFEPFAGVLERWADHLGTEPGRSRIHEYTTELAVLAAYAPRLREFVSEPAELSTLPPALARGRALRAMARVLEALSKAGPVLLLLDDLHWADDLTVEFLHEALTGQTVGRTSIVCSARPEALDVRLSTTLDSRPDVRLELHRLTLDDVRAMCREMLVTNLLPEGLGEFVFGHSAGNALLSSEYVEILAARGDLRRIGPQLWAFAEPTASQVPLPQSIEELLEAKFDTLSDAGRHLLERASVHGGDFTLDLLDEDDDEGSSALGLSLALPLEELARLQLVEEYAPERYRFTHEELREAIERALPQDYRQRLHASAVRRLLRRKSAGSTSVSDDTQLAQHYSRLGQHARAMTHLESAGRQAAGGHAYSLAGELLRAALVQGELAFERGAEEARRLLVPLREALADMLLRSARHEEARRNYDQIASDETTDALVRARALRKKAKSYWLVHDYDCALTALDEAAVELGDVQGLTATEWLREWIEVSQGRFWVHYFGRTIGAESADLVSRMAPIVERAGTSAQKAMFHQCAAGELMARHRYLFAEEAVRHARRAVEFSDPVGHPAEAADSWFALGFALVQGDRTACAEAVTLFSEAVQSLEGVGDATILARLLTYQAVAHRRLGQVAAVHRASVRALAAAEAARLPAYMAAATACLAWVAWSEGDLATAEQRAVEADTMWRNDRHVFPFRRLASFVLLAVRHSAEDFVGAGEAIATLLSPEQQVFPDALAQALEEARASLASGDARQTSEALLGALRIVHELGFD